MANLPLWSSDGGGHVTAWVIFTRRTDMPKLGWLATRCAEAGIPLRVNGETWHAPRTQVPMEQAEAAWAILLPVDDMPDDAPLFRPGRCPACQGPSFDAGGGACLPCARAEEQDRERDEAHARNP